MLEVHVLSSLLLQDCQHGASSSTASPTSDMFTLWCGWTWDHSATHLRRLWCSAAAPARGLCTVLRRYMSATRLALAPTWLSFTSQVYGFLRQVAMRPMSLHRIDFRYCLMNKTSCKMCLFQSVSWVICAVHSWQVTAIIQIATSQICDEPKHL